MASSNRVNATFTPGKGFGLPPTSTLATSPVNVFGVAPWQIGGVQISTNSINVPAFGPGQQAVSFSIPLSDLPQDFALPTYAKGSLLVSSSIAQLPPNQLPVVGVPYYALTGQGTALVQAGTGATAFALTPGRRYSQLVLTVTLMMYSSVAIPQEPKFLVTTWAMLVGQTTTQ